jgi:hypothetical protein
VRTILGGWSIIFFHKFLASGAKKSYIRHTQPKREYLKGEAVLFGELSLKPG